MIDKITPIPKLSDFPESHINSSVKTLLKLCEFQQKQIQLLKEQVSLQKEQIQALRDEVSILKGEKGKPKIKPSNLDKNDDGNPKSGGRKRRGKPKRKKTKKIKIHEEQIIEPENIPEGSQFKGYKDYIVQDLEISPKNTKYRRAMYLTPKGNYVIGELPESMRGSHFGVTLKSFILSQYHQQHVTQPLILEQLRDLGIEISSGQLNAILSEDYEYFKQERDDTLEAGLRHSKYVGTDDTGARHNGNNGYCNRIGNEFFTYFSSTFSKSRINFLRLLQGSEIRYVINDDARTYMSNNKLPKTQQQLFKEDKEFDSESSLKSFLQEAGIEQNNHLKIITESALFASLVQKGIANRLVILSDDAGQFAISGITNALCWVHAERNIKKIIPYSDRNREIQEKVREQIWNFYQKLKLYKLDPDPNQKIALKNDFEEIFSQKTAFQTLNLALNRILLNKEELLVVLENPEIPLHNNLSENDIRDYVKKRKISATTRSNMGRTLRDSLLSIKKTCKKLNIPFWEYLQDRIGRKYEIPPLHQLVSEAIVAA